MANRKSSRRNRRNTMRKNRRCWSRRDRKNMMGGGPAPVNDNSMEMSMADSLNQGQQYENIHREQHGGAAPYPGGVTDSVLRDSGLVAASRTGPLDQAIQQIQGMQDGGRRRNRRQRSKSRKAGKRKGRRGTSKRTRRNVSRRLRGGAFVGSPLSEPSMLLPAGLEKQAALNYEWSLAKDPSAFNPRP
jgi:hypothetical protein